MPEHDILTIEEVAAYLRVSERTVYDWANKGDIPCGKIGTTWRFKRAEIEKWVDGKLAPRKRQASETINLADVLTEDRVTIFEADRKDRALHTVIDRLALAPQVKKKQELVEEIFAREELMSTGIGFNVAVPHVRLASVTDLVMAVGVSRTDIPDYASLDDQPVRIICMVAARIDQHAQYLKTLGAISSLLRNPSLRKSLMNAPDPAAAYRILAG